MLGGAVIRLALLAHAFDVGLNTRNASELVQRSMKRFATAACTRFRLLDAILGAPGFERELAEKPTRRRVETEVVHRLCGAFCLEGRYDLVLEITKTVVADLERTGPPIASYKTELQEYVDPRGLGPATYEVVRESGPPHDRLFEVEVRLPDGRRARGRGKAKKEAGENAAQGLLEHYASRYLETRKRALTRPTAAQPLHVLHKEAELDRIAQLFRADGTDRRLLSAALTHPGVAERGLGDLHRALAQIGAALLETLLGQLFFHEMARAVGPDLLNAELVLGRVRKAEASAHAFDLLGLDRVFLRGRELILNERLKSDAFQATLAAVFIPTGDLRPELLPDKVLTYFRARVVEGFGTTAESLVDPKTALQERLQAVRIHWSYSLEARGPAHARTFDARLSLRAPHGEEGLTITGGSGPSRREAEKALAARVLPLFDAANERLGVVESPDTWDPVRKRIVAFLVLSEMRTACSSADPIVLTRLANEGNLGASLLLSGRINAFRRWADEAERLLAEVSYRLEVDDLSAYYRHLRALAGDSTSVFLERSVTAIARLVETLAPESYEGDLRESDGFRELLSLATVARLSSQAVQSRELREILDEIALLRSRRPPDINVEDGVPNVSVSLPDGSLQTLLFEVLEAMSGVPAVRVTASSDRPHRLDFVLRMSSPAPDLGRRLEILRRSAIWDFISRRLSSLEIGAEADVVRLALSFQPDASPEKTFAQLALAAFRSGDEADAAEIRILGTILHDLKNHLVAVHVALSSAGQERTARLRAQYDASRHLDAATNLVGTMRSVGRALGPARREAIDLGSFFREYFAEKFATLPANIELVLPTRTEGGQAWTDRVYLRSILDNLIKNAVEAMPDGGLISCEWMVADSEDRLLVEVADDGPGIGPALLEQLLAGQPVESTKEGGSGIGMSTVASMVSRLGGTITGESIIGAGTRFSIELPVAMPLRVGTPRGQLQLEESSV
jgi:signal transduction histidine kinase/dsRNA-specific ribonuclease